MGLSSERLLPARNQTTSPLVDVLLIEDDEVVITLIAAALHARDLTTDVAGDLTEARRLLSRTRYSVVVVDIVLPDGTGFEAIDFIKANDFSGMHVVVVTAADATTLQGLDRRRVKTVFFKPLNADHFASYVETLAKRP